MKENKKYLYAIKDTKTNKLNSKESNRYKVVTFELKEI